MPLLPRAFAAWLLASCSAAASAAYTSHAAAAAHTLSPSPPYDHQHPMINAVGGPVCCSRRRGDGAYATSMYELYIIYVLTSGVSEASHV